MLEQEAPKKIIKNQPKGCTEAALNVQTTLLSVFYVFYMMSEYVFKESGSVFIFPVLLAAPIFGIWQLIIGFTLHIRFGHTITSVYLWTSFIYLVLLIYFAGFLSPTPFLWAIAVTVPICLNWLLLYYYYRVLPYLDTPKDGRFEDILDA